MIKKKTKPGDSNQNPNIFSAQNAFKKVDNCKMSV